jgi:TRAP-type C4-dicarboxylate transport system substrate-binding protein
VRTPDDLKGRKIRVVHMRIPDVIAMSMKLWAQLNPDQQKAVLDAGARTQAYMRGA